EQIIPGLVQLRGASIFRYVSSASNGRVGARLIRCGDRPDAAPVVVNLAPATARNLRISAPEDLAVHLDGESLGSNTADVQTDRAFVRLRTVAASGREKSYWVALGANTEVHLAAPPEPPPSQATPQQRQKASRYFRRARRSLSSGRTKRARADLRRCVKAEPTHLGCIRGLGDVYRKLDQTKRARTYYRKYLALWPEAPDADRIRQWLGQ
ncbi:MAG: tetratricopeptide repeat protein, partial [Myxococcota bacterium]